MAGDECNKTNEGAAMVAVSSRFKPASVGRLLEYGSGLDTSLVQFTPENCSPLKKRNSQTEAEGYSGPNRH